MAQCLACGSDDANYNISGLCADCDGPAYEGFGESYDEVADEPHGDQDDRSMDIDDYQYDDIREDIGLEMRDET